MNKRKINVSFSSSLCEITDFFFSVSFCVSTEQNAGVICAAAVSNKQLICFLRWGETIFILFHAASSVLSQSVNVEAAMLEGQNYTEY